jgi:hypothetical protein
MCTQIVLTEHNVIALIVTQGVLAVTQIAIVFFITSLARSL